MKIPNKYFFPLMVLCCIVLVSAAFYPEPWGNNQDADGNNLSNVDWISANYFNGTLVGNSNTTTWWADLNNWTRTYFYKNGNSLDLNETKLNETIRKNPINWTFLQGYPVACPAGTYLTELGDSVVCTSISESSYDNLTITTELTANGTVINESGIYTPGNITIDENSRRCFDGPTCNVYQYYNGSDLITKVN